MKKLIVLLVLVMGSSAAFADTHYVDLNSPSPTPPYTNWVTAATNIQDAVDASSDGDTVLVADGRYILSEEIVVDKAITVQSVNGPENTIVDGNQQGPGFYLGSYSSTISGFAIQNGSGYFADLSTSSYYFGGGVYCPDEITPVVSNCVFQNNAADYGGGCIKALRWIAYFSIMLA